MCSNCFGTHIGKECTNQKVLWIDYVQDFMAKHEDIPQDYYGKWTKIINNSKKRHCLAAELGSMAASFVELADIPSTLSARKEAEKEMEVTVLDDEKEIVANASYKL